MLRGGYIKQISAGIYAYMPFLVRSLNKISQIVRGEMVRAGFEELLMPALQPKYFFTEDETPGSHDALEGIFEFRDCRGSRLCLGWPYQNMVADLIGKEISSYKQLPKRVFQIGTKFCDNKRPRFGLIRAREFISADAYSFDIDETEANVSYFAVRDAYENIFNRIGIEYKYVEADAGLVDDRGCYEFIILTDTGEDVFLYCDACTYAATEGKAESRLKLYPQEPSESPMEMTEVYGKGLIGVEALAEFLNIPVWKTTKTMLFQADDRVVAVMVRGDCEVNENKVKRFLGCRDLTLASPEVVKELTGAEVGYAGPIGLPEEVTVLADEYTKNRINFECGANRTDYHMINVNFGRDLPLPLFGDFKLAREGHFCPRCDNGILRQARGVSVGRLAMLGQKPGQESRKNWTYIDSQGKPRPFVMGYYSIGISRMMASIVEQSHDEFGIIWPIPVAPFQVHLIALNLEDEHVREEAEGLYRKLLDANVEVLFDDRDVRAGEKFDDADLLGMPVRLTISKRTLSERRIEVKLRGSKEKELITYEELLKKLGYLDLKTNYTQ